MDSTKKRSELVDLIWQYKDLNPHFLRVLKEHVSRLLEKTDKVEKEGASAFNSTEEYKDFAISKFFIDKGFKSLQKDFDPEAEEGELGSDDEDNREVPSLVIYPLTKYEHTKQNFAFWERASIGDVYIAKVLAVGTKIYDLMILNKNEDSGTIDVFSVSAFLMKSSVKDKLEVDDLVRVALLGYVQKNSVLKVKVTADPSEMEGLEDKKLGRIFMADILQRSPDDSKSLRWGLIYPNEVMDKNPENSFEMMSLLGIDPCKSYTFLPDNIGPTTKIDKKANNVPTKNEEEAIRALKTALQLKDLGETNASLEYANKAIDLNPEHDLAYSVRGSLYISQLVDEDQDFDVVMQGVTDCLKSLQLNTHNHIARNKLSDFLLECAVKLTKEEEYFHFSKELVELALKLNDTEEARRLNFTLMKLIEEKTKDMEDGEVV